MKVKDYFDFLDAEVKKYYVVASKARSKGIDPVSQVEVPQATSLAERVVGLISAVYPQVSQDRKIVDRILSLEKEHGSLDPAVALSIAEEIAKEKFCKFKSHHEAMEAGVRIAVAYLTLGVVSSPIEGFVELKVFKTMDGKDYFAPYYSGPIRSAGGTEAAFSLVIIDHLREVFGYDKYDPTDSEIKRGVHECYEYHERVTNLQYLPTEKELDFLMRNLPIQVSGDPSEDKEVYNYKDLKRIPTNFIRSGFALVMGEGIAQKAPKILKRIQKLKEKGFSLSGWDWMEDFVEMQHKIKENKSVGAEATAVYIKDLVAGRPVFAHPSFSGSFRLRYGRSRNIGYSTLALHPATMVLTDNFIAVGTQLKIEKPTKGCTIAPCDSINGPIVRLKDGSVFCVESAEKARILRPDVSEILYLGDILVPYGDFANRNHNLGKPSYVEKYWGEEVLKATGSYKEKVSFDEAIQISKKFGVPLHPDFIYYWNQIQYNSFLDLIDWLGHGDLKDSLVLPYGKLDKERFNKGKRALEIIGCEHKVGIENVVLDKEHTKAFLFNLGISDFENFNEKIDKLVTSLPKEGDVLEVVNSLCDFKIKDKTGTFIGARMGRPEKAKLRKLTGSPHVLFPVGAEGGRLRSLQAANEVGSVKSDFPIYYCANDKRYTVYPTCEICGEICKKQKYSFDEDKYVDLDNEEGRTIEYHNRRIDIRHYFNTAKRLTGTRIEELPVAVKGVRGTSSIDHSCENLAKGLLRAKYDLHVNKDGTIRYDMSEMPLTHFKPKEIGTSLQKLISLGYTHDINGEPLSHKDQILEIFPHDVVLPACPETLDERADDVFLNIVNFVDDELEKIYKLDRFFNITNKDDLAGVLLGCIAPHNCAAVVGRVIGFSKVQALLASPYIHAAMRRDCDGDEAAVMSLLDLLINFSKKFLPSHRGGTQDSPLVLNTHLRAGEVDDMIFDVDVSKKIPLELYQAAEKEESPFSVKMEQIKKRLGGPHEFDQINYSYEVSDINDAPICSAYKSLPTMQDKLSNMMALCKKIRAADVRDVARLTIERHFIRDIRGNLRKFSMQVFRCVGCNSKFRRPPLSGKCTNCGGKIIFTISEGSIIKYLASALDLARTYEVSRYLLECLELVEKDIHGIFGREKERQEALGKWF